MAKRIVHIWRLRDRRQLAEDFGPTQDGYVLVKLPRRDATRPTNPVELAQLRKQILKCNVRAGHVGKTSLRDFFKRRGAPSWFCDLVDELQCDACLEFNDKPGAAPVSLLEPPRLWQC